MVDTKQLQAFSTQLAHVSAAFDRPLNDKQIQQLLSFLALIAKWNKTHNLTALRGFEEMLVKHLYDSMSVAPHLPIGPVLDVGTGAGLPGIPLAILNPEQTFNLLDASHKRVAFMREVRRQIGLENITITHGRAEQQPEARHAVIISRAFSSLTEFIEKTQQLIDANGYWLAMKGAIPEAEITALNNSGIAHLEQCIALQVPKLNAERHLLIIRPA